MIDFVARLLLVVALVSASGSAPFAHIHPHGHDHGAVRLDDAQARNQPAHHQGEGGHWHLTGHHAADTPGTNTLVGDQHRPISVTLETNAIERPTVRIGTTPALVEVREAGIVPAPPARPVPVAANGRPNPPPRTVLGARAPPV